MSTSDQQGDRPLTRKQLREIRLTGATPVIGEDEAAAAAKQESQSPAVPLARPAEPADVPPAPVADAPADSAYAPLTRRQARAQERIRTASVPVAEPGAEEPQPADEAPADPDETDASQDLEPTRDEVVSSIPAFGPATAESVDDEAAERETPFEADVDEESDDLSAVIAASSDQSEDVEDADVAGDELPVADAVITGERPIVSPRFGNQLLGERSEVPDFSPSFDELITTDSGGSHRAPNTLIFTHPGEGSLSGPVASTGELLITGSYELPKGLGSQGHAHGTTDGREIDAVLIDGELPPASSPTPIAASSAVSTTKPAGEVIRPPAPDKGNKLMLTLAITAGGLALALAVALVFAFSTNLFG